MNDKTIIIVGCGNLGFRHFEGVCKSSCNLSIHLYDWSPEALRNIKKRIEKSSIDLSHLVVKYWSNLDSLCDSFGRVNLVVVATTAVGRGSLLSQVFEKIKSDFWIIEKPISTSVRDLLTIKDYVASNNIWVNFPRRASRWYEQLQQLLSESNSPFTIEVVSSDLGIACNAGHFIDLVNFLNFEFPVAVQCSKLDQFWTPSKRQGYYDLQGWLSIDFSGGSVLRLGSGPKWEESLIKVFDGKQKLLCEINENNGTSEFTDGRFLDGKVPNQSDLTGFIFDNLLKNGKCQLTPLSIAIDCNFALVTALEDHWKSFGHTKDSLIPLYT